MVKKYIDQEEWISRLKKELKETTNEKRKSYLNIWINTIKCQPTLDEKEIIRKAFGRVIQRAEEEYDVMNWDRPWAITINRLKEIIKEECGINE